MDKEYILEQVREFLEKGDIGELSIEHKPNGDVLLKKRVSEMVKSEKNKNWIYRYDVRRSDHI